MEMRAISRDRLFDHLRSTLGGVETTVHKDPGLTRGCKAFIEDRVGEAYRYYANLLSNAGGETIQAMQDDAARQAASYRRTGKTVGVAGLGTGAALGLGATLSALASLPSGATVAMGVAAGVAAVIGLGGWGINSDNGQLMDRVRAELGAWGAVIAAQGEPAAKGTPAA